MKWTQDADESIQKVPFFVRKRVRARVEKEAKNAAKKVVSLADVKATQARYLSGMKRADVSDGILEKIEAMSKESGLLGFLKKRVKGDRKFRHECRITLADGPNACCQPQIKAIGSIAACPPK